MNNKREIIVVSVAVLIGVTALLLGTLIGLSGRRNDSGAPAPAAAPTPAAASYRNYDEIFIPNSAIGTLDARKL